MLTDNLCLLSYQALGDDVLATLFAPGSEEAKKIKVNYHQKTTLVVEGGRPSWKRNLTEWLLGRGF